MEELRTTPRYRFVAPAVILHEASGKKIDGQVRELSLHGCYLDTGTPLETHNRVTVKIYWGWDFFEAAATVIYSNPMLGMGLGFRQVRPYFREVLRNWVLMAMRASEAGKDAK
jgi:hypothetical protein